MKRIDIGQAAMAAGAVGAVWQTIWVMLMAAGWAKPFLVFLFIFGFIEPGFELAPFSTVVALSSIAILFCAGALTGAMFAFFWNAFGAERAPKWARDTRQREALDKPL